jgi:hypothetical protein
MALRAHRSPGEFVYPEIAPALACHSTPPFPVAGTAVPARQARHQVTRMVNFMRSGAMAIALESGGDGLAATTLTGTVDPAGLQGLLRRLYSVGRKYPLRCAVSKCRRRGRSVLAPRGARSQPHREPGPSGAGEGYKRTEGSLSVEVAFRRPRSPERAMKDDISDIAAMYDGSVETEHSRLERTSSSSTA